MQDFASEGAAWGFRLRLGPVDTRHAALVMAAVGIFLAIDDDAGVQERGADEPEGGGEATGLEGMRR